MLIPEYIEVKTAAGERKAFLSPSSDKLKDCYIDNHLNGPSTLTFKLPIDNEKWEYIVSMNRIYAGGKEFVIVTPNKDAVETVRDDDGIWGIVKAQESWILLGKKHVTVSNDAQNPSPSWSSVIILSGGAAFDAECVAGSAKNALKYLLESTDTGWTVGTVDVAGTHDLENQKEPLLSNITKVQELWGGLFVWDSFNKTVSLRDETAWANDIGFAVRYAKNQKGIERTVDMNIVTRLYPFGADDLDISSVNTIFSGDITGVGHGLEPDGSEYTTITLSSGASTIDDYYVGAEIIYTYQSVERTHKISQYNGSFKQVRVEGNVGVDTVPCTIRSIFLMDTSYTEEILEGILSVPDIGDAQQLKDHSEKVLDKLSRPRINYRLPLADLQTLPEYSHESFALGDIVTVGDPEADKWRPRVVTTDDLTAAMNSTPKLPNWDADCDFNNDGVVDIYDSIYLSQRGGSVVVFSDAPAKVRVIRHNYNVFQPWLCQIEVGDPVEELANYIADIKEVADNVRDVVNGNKKVPGYKLVDESIIAAKLAPASVTTAAIADSAVDVNKLADLAVEAAKLADGAVLTAKLGDAAVDAAKIAALAVTGEKIPAAAIGTAHIQTAAITTALIEDAAINSAKIANAAVGSLAVAAAAIGTAHIAEGAILSANIGDAQIITAKIADLAVNTAKIADLAVTDAKIDKLSAGKISAGTISASVEMTSAVVTGGIIRTASSGKRLEIDSNGLLGYNSDNEKLLEMSVNTFYEDGAYLRIQNPKILPSPAMDIGLLTAGTKYYARFWALEGAIAHILADNNNVIIEAKQNNDVQIIGSDNVTIDATNLDITLNAGDDIHVTASDDININAGSYLDLTATTKIRLNSPIEVLGAMTAGTGGSIAATTATDSDKLDGKHASAFALSAHEHVPGDLDLDYIDIGYRASAPSGIAGRMYYNSTIAKLMFYANGQWRTISWT